MSQPISILLKVAKPILLNLIVDNGFVIVPCYVPEAKSTLNLGETETTAYRGDRGKAAYDHSQLTNGSNPHGTTFGSLNQKPSTIEGFGITDVYAKSVFGNPDTDFIVTFENALV
jgi:hypothetical protein